MVDTLTQDELIRRFAKIEWRLDQIDGKLRNAAATIIRPNCIGWAIKELLQGNNLRRKSWHVADAFVCLVDRNSKNAMYIALTKGGQVYRPWAPTHDDLLGTDWELVA